MAELAKFKLRAGDAAPDFTLPGVDGKSHRRDDFSGSPYLLVTFWCNHCPYVQAWEGRMIALAHEYRSQGLQVVLINSNDEVAFPDDRFERMSARSKEMQYPFPYLRDESQQVALAYGALVTPHPMLFGPDRRLLFQGRIDDNYDHPEAVKDRFVAEAIDAAIAGRAVPRTETAVLGCSVKWKT